MSSEQRVCYVTAMCHGVTVACSGGTIETELGMLSEAC